MEDIRYTKTQEEYRRLMVELLPELPLYADKRIENTDLYKFCDSIGAVFAFFDKDWQEIYDTSFISTANLQSIIRWENELKLPDNIFTENKDLKTRIQQCLIKKWISDYGVSSPQDYYQLASYLGFDNVRIDFSGEAQSALSLPFTLQAFLFGNIDAQQFTWFIHFPKEYANSNVLPLELPFELAPLTGVARVILLFEKIRPSYVELIYVYDL